MIQVFLEHKVHATWLCEGDAVPPVLEHDGLTCATEVFQVGGELAAPSEPGPLSGPALQLRQRLRGGDPYLQPGSQLSFQDDSGEQASGTLAAFARCRETGKLGLLTNAHVGVFEGNVLTHPDVHSRIVARVTRLVRLEPAASHWGGVIQVPDAHFLLDCAFAELVDPLPPLRTELPWLSDEGTVEYAPLGTAREIDLDDPALWPIGTAVFSVGRSRGEQRGTVRGLAFQYADGPHVSCYTDLLVTSEDESEGGWFSWPGDSGKLVVTDDEDAIPVGLLWGGNLLRTNRDYELVDHSFAAGAFAVQEALGIDLLRELPKR